MCIINLLASSSAMNPTFTSLKVELLSDHEKLSGAAFYFQLQLGEETERALYK